MDEDQTVPALVPRGDAERNLRRAGIKLIPYLGDALDELAYGHLVEARWDRLERTLSELGEMMKERNIPAAEVTKEDFANLLEAVAPAASRTTSEQKRVLLRDLLLNAVTLPPGDGEWESARLAADLITDVSVAGVAILAALAELGARGEALARLRSVKDGASSEVALNWNEGWWSRWTSIGWSWTKPIVP